MVPRVLSLPAAARSLGAIQAHQPATTAWLLVSGPEGGLSAEEESRLTEHGLTTRVKDRGYADKYRARGEPIHLIGVEFSREERSVVGFEVEATC